MTWGIANYSTTPASNTAINGINIAPGCPSSSVGPFMRQLMADIAAALSAGQFMPPGIIVHYPATVVPAGYLACDGSAVSRTTYAALFAIIGTFYGAGDGSTTFNLPDIRGRVIAGYDSGNATGRLTASTAQGVSASTVGNTGGEQAHTLVTGELAAHTHANSLSDPTHVHTINDPTHFHTIATSSATLGSVGDTAQGGNNAGPINTNAASTGISLNPVATGITITNASAGSGNAHNTVQPTIVQLACIKT